MLKLVTSPATTTVYLMTSVHSSPGEAGGSHVGGGDAAGESELEDEFATTTITVATEATTLKSASARYTGPSFTSAFTQGADLPFSKTRGSIIRGSESPWRAGPIVSVMLSLPGVVIY
jgi:hypothetical protein